MNNLKGFCDPFRMPFTMEHQPEGGLAVPSTMMPSAKDFSNISGKPIEDLIAADLQALTFKERQEITDEIHGVGNQKIEESVEIVQEALRAMREDYLPSIMNSSNSASNTPPQTATDSSASSASATARPQRIASNKRHAYDRAVFLRPLLEKDDKLFLMFLRARRFDPYKAAQHMCTYFENKLILFGEELLHQKITLQDLTPHEIQLIREGTYHLSEGRERVGRGICYSNVGQWDLSDPKALIRSMWYVISAIEDNEDMQRKGIVIIGNWQGPFRHSLYDILAFFTQMQQFNQNWTFRTESVHTLYNNVTFDAFFKTLTATISKDFRLRHRFHFGSQLEIIYSLRTFGIDAEDFIYGPICVGGRPEWRCKSQESVEEYLQRRGLEEDQWRAAEKPFQDPNASLALVPNQNDILMGRSKIASKWPGNLLYHSMVAQYVPRYMNPLNKDRIDKTLIAMEVIHALQKDYGSRFLSRKESRWVVPDDAEIKKKVSQSLRIEAKGKQLARPS